MEPEHATNGTARQGDLADRLAIETPRLEEAAAKRKRRPRKERLARMGKEILDVKGASEFLGIAESTLYRMARRGVVPAVKAGKEWRFARQSLVAWVANGGQTSQLEALFKRAKPAVRPKG